MENLKRKFLAIVAFLIVGIISGCSPKAVLNLEMGPVDILNNYYRECEAKNYQRAFTYIAEHTLEFLDLDLESAIEEKKVYDAMNNISLVGWEIISEQDYDDNIKVIRVVEKYIKDDSKENIDSLMVLEDYGNGIWKINYNKFIDGLVWDDTSYDEGEDDMLTIGPERFAKQPDGMWVRVFFLNKTDINYKLGWTHPANIKIVTDKGTYYGDIEGDINKNTLQSFEATVPEAEGEITSLTVEGIYAMEDKGLPSFQPPADFTFWTNPEYEEGDDSGRDNGEDGDSKTIDGDNSSEETKENGDKKNKGSDSESLSNKRDKGYTFENVSGKSIGGTVVININSIEFLPDRTLLAITIENNRKENVNIFSPYDLYLVDTENKKQYSTSIFDSMDVTSKISPGVIKDIVITFEGISDIPKVLEFRGDLFSMTPMSQDNRRFNIPIPLD